MRSSARPLSWSMVDQAAVSGGNFLAIFLGAALLPVDEQAKLVYVFSCYFGLVLFNVAAYFGVANTVLPTTRDGLRYRGFLARRQVASGLLLAIAASGGLFALGDSLGVGFGGDEAILVGVLLASQQMADFVRRCGYVFSTPRQAARVSVFTHGGRTLLLLAFRPDSFGEYLGLLAVTPVAVTIWLIVQENWLQPALRGSDDGVRSHWGLSRWLLLDAPLKWLGVHAPIILVGYLYSGHAAAALGTIRAVMSFANVFLEQLETVVPRMFAARSLVGESALRETTLRMLWIGVTAWAFGLLGIWGLKPWLIMLFDPFYWPYYGLGYLIWSANGVYFVAKVLALENRAQRDTATELVGSATGVLGLGISLFAFDKYDAWAGAGSLLLVQLGVLVGVLLRKHWLVARSRAC